MNADILSGSIPSTAGFWRSAGFYRYLVRQSRPWKYQGLAEAMRAIHGEDLCDDESMWARMKSELFYDRLAPERLAVEELKALVWRYFMSRWNRRRLTG